MSSATYPQGMNSYNNRTNIGGYKSWKGDGPFRNPTGITAGNIRPLTNKDMRNAAPAAFGRPRPIKHYRRGISIPVPIFVEDPENPGQLIESYYYSNREVNSSVQDKMVAQMQDQPGRFIVKDNGLRPDIQEGEDVIDEDCRQCKGVGIVSSWMPTTNLTEQPQENVTNPILCCNQQRKAIRRVRPASTIVNKNYYQTMGMYLYNRCQTFKQREFNFVKDVVTPEDSEPYESYPFVTDEIIANSKPGEPLAALNLYVAQCVPNGSMNVAVIISLIRILLDALLENNLITQEEYDGLKAANLTTLRALEQLLNTIQGSEERRKATFAFLLGILDNPQYASIIRGPTNPQGCKRVYYKPNNPQFAQQGAVANSTRLLKLNVQTIEKNAASIRRERAVETANGVVQGTLPATPFIYKMKSPACNPSLYAKNGNPKMCNINQRQ